MDKFTYLIMLAAYGAIIDVAVIILNRRKRHSEQSVVGTR
jgi:hypothetical protein